MANICLVACVKSKLAHPEKARDIYISSLFQKSRKIAEEEYDQWYILSAEYGLLDPDTKIKPYEKTLNKMTRDERIDWAKRVRQQLEEVVTENDSVTFFAGINYRKYLVEELKNANCGVYFPMEGMSIGNQLRWLSLPREEREILKDLETFYGLIDKLERGLAGKKSVGDLTGKTEIPKKGLYFFFEPTEKRKFKPGDLRVTRVGTHAVSAGSKSTLWNRIKTHIGVQSGGGNHRGSIFRLHIGNALIEKNKLRKKYPSWGEGQTAKKDQKETELPLEEKVSAYISKMKILWLWINDESGPESDRAFIERNAIGLLSLAVPMLDAPSNEWLGSYSISEPIRVSGLWNINHVGGGYCREFLSVFEHYVMATIGEANIPKETMSKQLKSAKIINGSAQIDLCYEEGAYGW